jgi:hypothetical protein
MIKPGYYIWPEREPSRVTYAATWGGAAWTAWWVGMKTTFHNPARAQRVTTLRVGV